MPPGLYTAAMGYIPLSAGARANVSPLPRRIFRHFKEEKHALALLRGDVWISTLDTCRHHEAMGQGDPDEGLLSYHVTSANSDSPTFSKVARGLELGGLKFAGKSSSITNCGSTFRLDDAYVLCWTETLSQDVARTFGNYVVEVTDARKFFELVTFRLCIKRKLVERMFGPVVYVPALTYSDLQDPPGPPGFVKRPDGYAGQQEIRMLWTSGGPFPLEPFLLTVPRVARLCRLIRTSAPRLSQEVT